MFAPPDDLDELAQAGVGIDEAESGRRHGEGDRGGRDAQIAGERELEPAADGRAVESRPAWIRIALERIDRGRKGMGDQPLSSRRGHPWLAWPMSYPAEKIDPSPVTITHLASSPDRVVATASRIAWSSAPTLSGIGDRQRATPEAGSSTSKRPTVDSAAGRAIRGRLAGRLPRPTVPPRTGSP